MKKIRFLFITLLLAALFTVAVSADALVAHITCDNYKDWWYVTDNYYSMDSLEESQCWVDTENQTEGEGCISAKENPYFFGAPIYCFEWFMWNTPQSWDIDLDSGYVTFDFYTDDPEHCFNASRFEIGFSEMIGALDAHEIEWILNETGEDLKSQVKKGWNTFTLKFSDALIVGNVDFDHVSYIRFFGLQVAEGSTFKIDNIRIMTSAYDDADTLVYNSNTVDDPMQAAAKKEAEAREQQKIESGMALKVDGVPADAKNVLGEMEELTGIWEISENKAVSTSATVGDSMLVSEKFVAPDEKFVFSMDTVLTESSFDNGGVGPMLIVGDIYNPINTGAIILRTDYNAGVGLSNFFSYNTKAVSIGSAFDGPAYAIGDKIHYDLVYDGNYNFYAYTNGELTHVVDGTGFEGAYLGILVWSGAGYFENITFSNNISLFTGEAAVEEPVVEEPVVEEPVVEEPVVEEPVVEEPVVEEPVVEEPVVEEPVVEEPKVEEPKVEEPKVEEPKVEEPKVEKPVVEAPKTADAIVVLAVAALVSGGAALVSKKRK